MSRLARENVKLARAIFHSCLETGELNEKRLLEFVKTLTSNPSRQSKQILLAVVKFVEAYQSERKLVVESPFLLEERQEKELLEKFEKLLTKKLTLEVVENKALIGGVKVKNQDTVWENTVGSNLEQLKGDFLQG